MIIDIFRSLGSLSILSWFRGLFHRKTYSMAIVRRYTDANGSFVGELYLLGTFMGTLQYAQIGMSLDTLPFEIRAIENVNLDVENDFLKPMPQGCVRIGAQDPKEDYAVRSHVARIAKEGKISLQIQNRFVEYVLGKGTGKNE